MLKRKRVYCSNNNSCDEASTLVGLLSLFSLSSHPAFSAINFVALPIKLPTGMKIPNKSGPYFKTVSPTSAMLFRKRNLLFLDITRSARILSPSPDSIAVTSLNAKKETFLLIKLEH